jgi:hypothetical protein
MRTPRAKTFIWVGILIGLLAGVALAATFNPGDAGKVSDGVAFGAPDGLNVTVYGEANVTMEDVFPDSSTVELNTSKGNISLTSTGVSAAAVHTSNMTGTWTNVTGITAGSTWIEVYPSDKQRVDVRGDTDQLSIKAVTIDDGNTDLWVEGMNGGTATVKLYTFPANTKLVARDSNGNVVAKDTSDANGNATFDIGLSTKTISFESVNNKAPEQDNADPTGKITSNPDEVSVDVSDANFDDGDEVNVKIWHDGSLVKDTNITSNSTVTANIGNINLGTHKWNVTATDYYGAQTTANYTYTTPSTLFVVNETLPHNKIDQVTVNATITSNGTTVDLQETGTGEFSLVGLPADLTYVFTVNAPGYHVREVYIDNIFEQQTIYLLNKSVASVENSITVTDRTGRFSENPVVIVERVINSSKVSVTPDNGPEWVTMGGDRLGAGGFYIVDLQQNARYRFKAQSVQGDVRVLGEYTAKSNGTIDLEIGTIEYDLGGPEQGYQWTTSLVNQTNGAWTAKFAYNDTTNSTEWVDVVVKTRENGTVLGSKNFTSGPYGEVGYTLPVSNSTVENKTLVIEWSANRNGEIISGKRLADGKALLSFPLDPMWRSVAFALVTLVLAFLVGAGVGVAPALVTISVWSGLAVFIGFAPAALGFGATLVVLLMGAIYMVQAPDTTNA